MPQRPSSTPILFASLFIVMLGFGIVVPILPFYVTHFGASGRELGLLAQGGAQIYSLPKLHAKLTMFDNNVIIGSANISESSATALKEIGIIADSPQLIKDARSIIDNLRHIPQQERYG